MLNIDNRTVPDRESSPGSWFAAASHLKRIQAAAIGVLATKDFDVVAYRLRTGRTTVQIFAQVAPLDTHWLLSRLKQVPSSRPIAQKRAYSTTDDISDLKACAE